MRFEVRLPGSPSVWEFRAAGVHVDGLFEFWHDLFVYRRSSLPTELDGEYFRSDPPVKVRIKVLAFEPHTQVQIEVANDAIGRKIRERLVHYSVENDGRVVAEREHEALWAQINKTLERDGLSYDELRYEKGVLTRRTIEALTRLCETTDPIRWRDIYRLFDKHSVPTGERVFTARWLVKLFEAERDPDEEIGISLDDLAVPEIANDLIRLIKDRRYGNRRWPLCLALARTKHPLAADVIASLLGDGWNTRGALEALGKLRATKYVDKIRKYLRDPDSDVRREAKKTPKKLGFPVETPPPPVHLVEKRSAIPKALEESSGNLDLDDLNPTLEKLARCVDRGFGRQEIAEVGGVVEEMKAEQTKVFRFPVTASDKTADLWVEIFMDDVDAPDLTVHADPGIIAKLGALTGGT